MGPYGATIVTTTITAIATITTPITITITTTTSITSTITTTTMLDIPTQYMSMRCMDHQGRVLLNVNYDVIPTVVDNTPVRVAPVWTRKA